MDAVAAWADDVRDRAQYEWTKPLHYVNVPRDARRIDMDRDCEDNMCAIGAIEEFSRIVASREASPLDRTEALQFIIHFIGDIHQPMHVSYEDDRGGNMITVNFMGDRNTNLHRVWDSGILRRHIEIHWRDTAKDIIDRISEENKQEWSTSRSPIEWANESLDITRRIYDELPRSGVLDRSYYEHNEDAVVEQLARAGVRLAAHLNELFRPKTEEEPGEEPSETDVADDDIEEKAEEEVEVADATESIALVEGDPCGRMDGRTIFLRNTHDTRAIEVVVRQTWTDGEREHATDRRFTLQPGERAQRRLGCSEQEARGRLREFSWEVVEASFRGR